MCQAGTIDTVCGAGGTLCIACPTNQFCGGSGKCEVKTVVGGGCSASNCTGCCDSSGSCRTGNTTTACGASGNACAVCAMNQTCSSGHCL
jgi:hypothetical protein